jgi:hypothetical protein
VQFLQTKKSIGMDKIEFWNRLKGKFEITEAGAAYGPRNKYEKEVKGSKFTDIHHFFRYRLTNFASSDVYMEFYKVFWPFNTVVDHGNAKIDINLGTDDPELMDAAIEAGIIDLALIKGFRKDCTSHKKSAHPRSEPHSLSSQPK